LVGGLEHFLFSPIVGMMIQFDFHSIIFQGVGKPGKPPGPQSSRWGFATAPSLSLHCAIPFEIRTPKLSRISSEQAFRRSSQWMGKGPPKTDVGMMLE